MIKFVKFLNSTHHNITFTTEINSRKCLSFLNVLVDNSEPNLVTTSFRKPTHADLYTKWISFVPRGFKMNSIFFRQWNICVKCLS